MAKKKPTKYDKKIKVDKTFNQLLTLAANLNQRTGTLLLELSSCECE